MVEGSRESPCLWVRMGSTGDACDLSNELYRNIIERVILGYNQRLCSEPVDSKQLLIAQHHLRLRETHNKVSAKKWNQNGNLGCCDRGRWNNGIVRKTSLYNKFLPELVSGDQKET